MKAIDSASIFERNKKIFRLVVEGKTYEEVGALYNLSKEAVRQVCMKAIRRIYHALPAEQRASITGDYSALTHIRFNKDFWIERMVLLVDTQKKRKEDLTERNEDILYAILDGVNIKDPSFWKNFRLQDQAVRVICRQLCQDLDEEEKEPSNSIKYAPPRVFKNREYWLRLLNKRTGNYSIETLDPTVRVYNALVACEIKTIRQLRKLTEAELFKIPNLGRKSIMEIKELLHAHGYKLKGKE